MKKTKTRLSGREWIVSLGKGKKLKIDNFSRILEIKERLDIGL